MSAWRRSISSTKKVEPASGSRVAVVVVVAYLRERHRPRSETISIRPNRIARLDGGTNIFQSIHKRAIAEWLFVSGESDQRQVHIHSSEQAG